MFTIYDLSTVAALVGAAVVAKYGVDMLCSKKIFINRKRKIFSLSKEKDLFYCPGDEDIENLNKIKD